MNTNISFPFDPAISLNVSQSFIFTLDENVCVRMWIVLLRCTHTHLSTYYLHTYSLAQSLKHTYTPTCNHVITRIFCLIACITCPVDGHAHTLTHSHAFEEIFNKRVRRMH